MKSPFDLIKVVKAEPNELLIPAIFIKESEVHSVVDEDGEIHTVNITKNRVLSHSDNIPKDIDADTLSMENCIKNNYNLQEVNGYNSDEESPESVFTQIDIPIVAEKLKPISSTLDKKETIQDKPQQETNIE